MATIITAANLAAQITNPAALSLAVGQSVITIQQAIQTGQMAGKVERGVFNYAILSGIPDLNAVQYTELCPVTGAGPFTLVA